MPVEYLYAPEWREDRRGTRYPFSDQASLKARTGMTLRRECFQDALVYPPGALAGTAITSIAVAPRNVTVSVGDVRNLARASTSFDPLNAPETLRLAAPDGRAAGILVADALVLAEFQVWPRGPHEFPIGASGNTGAAEFVGGVVVPSPGVGLAGLKLEDGTLLTGDVWFVGEDGVVVRTTDDGIRVDVIGDPDFRLRLCATNELFEPPMLIRTINGVRPNAQGEFQFEAGNRLSEDTVLRVVPEPPDLLHIYAAGKPAGRA